MGENASFCSKSPQKRAKNAQKCAKSGIVGIIAPIISGALGQGRPTCGAACEPLMQRAGYDTIPVANSVCSRFFRVGAAGGRPIKATSSV